MLYILRPLIYAVLQHQLHIHRSKVNTTANSSTTTASAEVKTTLARVLDSVTIDTLLSMLVLIISFVSQHFTICVMYIYINIYKHYCSTLHCTILTIYNNTL